MAEAYGYIKTDKRQKKISLYKDSITGRYYWYFSNGSRVKQIRGAKSISDAKINAWETYRERFSAGGLTMKRRSGTMDKE